MARSWYGGTSADQVVRPFNFGLRRLASLAAGARVTFWDAETGGTQHLDLLLGGVTPASFVTADEFGYLERFQGPDAVTTMWADMGDDEPRRMVVTTDGAITAAENLANKIDVVEKGASDGVATLDSVGKLVQNVDAERITSGEVALERLPVLDAGRVPALDASKITTGILDAARVPAATTNPNVRGVPIYSYGHSYTIYPNPYTTPETGEYPELLRRRLLMGKGYFRGRSGTPLQDTISGVLSPTLGAQHSTNAQWVPGSRGVVLLQNYANEAAGNNGSAEYLSGWKHALRTFMAITSAKSVQKWADNTGTAGTWTKLGGGAERHWDDEVHYSSEASATVSFSVTGDEVWLLSVISTATYGPNADGAGALDVFVNSTDNPVHLTHDPAGKMEQFTSKYDDAQVRGYTPTAVKITGLDAAAGTSGAKTIIVRTKDAGSNHFVSAVIEPMPDPPHVFVAYEPPRNPGTNGADNLAALDASYRALIDEIADEFPDRLHVVDLAPGWQNPQFVSSLDTTHNFHPNDLGMAHIADAFEEAIDAEITVPIAGVLTL